MRTFNASPLILVRLRSEKVIIIFVDVARNLEIQDAGVGSVHLKNINAYLEKKISKKHGRVD